MKTIKGCSAASNQSIVYYARRQQIKNIYKIYSESYKKTVHTSKKNLGLYKYHVKIECSVDSKVCQTAVLIGISYALMSYFKPIAMNKLYLNDDILAPNYQNNTSYARRLIFSDR